MKKQLYHYRPLVVLAIFASVALIALEAAIFIRSTMFDLDIYAQAMDQRHVSDAMYDELMEYFKSLSAATGIPEEVYTDPIDKETLYKSSFRLLQECLDYFTDEKASKPMITYDFSPLSESIRDYVSRDADERQIVKDDEYYKLLDNTVSIAKSQVESRLDVMMLYTLSKTRFASTLHTGYKYVKIAMWVFAGLLLALIIAMVIIDRHHPRDYPYWAGLILTASSGSLLIPAVILKKTGYFDQFFISNEYIYQTVTGLFENILDSTIRMQLILFITGVVLIISTLIIHAAYVRYLKKKYKKHHWGDTHHEHTEQTQAEASAEENAEA